MYFVDNAAQQKLLNMGEAVQALETAYFAWSEGQAMLRPKSNLLVYHNDESNVYSFSTMEGALQDPGLVAIRIKSDLQPIRTPGVRARKQAGVEGQYCGLVQLFDSRTGLPIAILNDGYIQHARVGATAGLAAKYLAREQSTVLGVLGSQWMARTHVPAICSVRPIQRVQVYSPNREHREDFAREMRERLGIDVEAHETPEAAVAGADIVACCTDSVRAPVLHGAWLEKGMHISNVLSAELDAECLARIDHTVKHQPLRDLSHHILEAGQPPAGAERPSEGLGWTRQVSQDTPLLTDIMRGRAPGRTSDEQITFFSNNEGTGIQFAALGALLVAKLRQSKPPEVRELPTEWFLQDIPD